MKELCAKNGHLKYEIKHTDKNRHLKIVINRFDCIDLIGLTCVGANDAFHRGIIFNIIGGVATTATTATRMWNIIRSRLVIMCECVRIHRNISRRYHRHAVGTRPLNPLHNLIHYVIGDLLLMLLMLMLLLMSVGRSIYHWRVDKWRTTAATATATPVSASRCLTT